MTLIRNLQTILKNNLHTFRHQGLGILPRKLWGWSLVALALPVLLLVRLLKPLVHIRFGVLPCIRIGHFAAEPELYLCMREAGLLPQNTRDLFWFSGAISNQQLALMWRRVLPMHPFYHRLYLLNRQLFHFNDHLIPRLPSEDRDLHGILWQTPPHLTFTPAEHTRGKAELAALGVAAETPFICFHSRDSGYSALGISDQQIRLYACRNSKVETYLPAMEALAEQGYACLRMGVAVEKPLTSNHPRIINYANTSRNDFMDVYLSAHCRFYIGDTSGLAEVPKIFRRPVAWVNFFALEYAPTWGKHDLFIPSKIWHQAENRPLTFREILTSGVGRFRHCTEFEAQGLAVIPNTAEEILALALEMDKRISGTWQDSPEDEALQSRFWALFQPSAINGVFLCRIGAAFLREQQHLLD